MSPKTRLQVTVFSDFICPFCYIGYVRLLKLREEYDLRVNWRYLEIHPDNPAQGRPLSELGYAPDRWKAMMDNLAQMAKQEGIEFAEREFTTNSRQALLLAEASKALDRDTFYALNGRLFQAFFCERKNLGSEAVLRALARELDIGDELIDAAWSDAKYAEMLRKNIEEAGRLGVRGVPTYIFSSSVLAGAVAIDALRAAARASIDGSVASETASSSPGSGSG